MKIILSLFQWHLFYQAKKKSFSWTKQFNWTFTNSGNDFRFCKKQVTSENDGDPIINNLFEIKQRPFTDNIMTATVDFNEILDTKPVCLKANLTQHETSVLFIPLKLWTNINSYMRGEFLRLGSPADDSSDSVVRGSLISTVSTFTTSTSSFCTWNFIPNKVHLSSNGLILMSIF